jgi:hypothetical protein
MKKIVIVAAMMGAFGAGVGTTLVSGTANADPSLTIQSEEAAHPQIVEAIHRLREARGHLNAAGHDFGGNKAKAVDDTTKAIHSLKKALYYRLKLDDAAIDAAQGGT